MTKVADLKVKTDDQLVEQLVELKREAFNLRFQAATNQLEKPARVRCARRAQGEAPALRQDHSPLEEISCA